MPEAPEDTAQEARAGVTTRLQALGYPDDVAGWIAEWTIGWTAAQIGEAAAAIVDQHQNLAQSFSHRDVFTLAFNHPGTAHTALLQARHGYAALASRGYGGHQVAQVVRSGPANGVGMLPAVHDALTPLGYVPDDITRIVSDQGFLLSDCDELVSHHRHHPSLEPRFMVEAFYYGNIPERLQFLRENMGALRHLGFHEHRQTEHDAHENEIAAIASGLNLDAAEVMIEHHARLRNVVGLSNAHLADMIHEGANSRTLDVIASLPAGTVPDILRANQLVDLAVEEDGADLIRDTVLEAQGAFPAARQAKELLDGLRDEISFGEMRVALQVLRLSSLEDEAEARREEGRETGASLDDPESLLALALKQACTGMGPRTENDAEIGQKALDARYEERLTRLALERYERSLADPVGGSRGQAAGSAAGPWPELVRGALESMPRDPRGRSVEERTAPRREALARLRSVRGDLEPALWNGLRDAIDAVMAEKAPHMPLLPGQQVFTMALERVGGLDERQRSALRRRADRAVDRGEDELLWRWLGTVAGARRSGASNSRRRPAPSPPEGRDARRQRRHA